MDVNKGLCLLQMAARDATIAADKATISALQSGLTKAQTIIRYDERKIQAPRRSVQL